jgi:hypothetical protein
MNIRHAAALALVGWYLLISPADKPDAPLSQWHVFKSFDKAAECESERTDGVGAGNWNWEVPRFSEKSDPAGWKLPRSTCVQGDDPRLK